MAFRLLFFISSPDGSKTGLVDAIVFGEIKNPELIVTNNLSNDNDTIIEKLNNPDLSFIIFKDSDQFTILAKGICPTDEPSNDAIVADAKSSSKYDKNDECTNEPPDSTVESSMEVLLQMASLSKNAYARGGCPKDYHKECTTVVSGGDVYQEKCYCEAN